MFHRSPDLPTSPAPGTPPLHDVQCGLVPPEGPREFLAALLDFIADPDDVKVALAAFAAHNLAPASERANPPQSLCISFLLNAAGYLALGLSPGVFAEGQTAFPGLVAPGESIVPILGPPGPHAMLMLAADPQADLHGPLADLLAELDGLVRAALVESRVITLQDEDEPGEEIVYRDVMMNPVLLATSPENAPADGAPPSSDELLRQLLVPDPYAERPDACGGYFVFRRMPSLQRSGGLDLRSGRFSIPRGEYFFAPSLSFFRSLERF